ncbi:organic cation transporter [Brachionus plicatilis]|uniref:Organic cation transporter n=1 Tax=Brachionus plicatilis TaxID=10195 RepID=A0A3M7P6M6_BRAPC|nr:organic cation transporter [Brachionus plicatilis]
MTKVEEMLENLNGFGKYQKFRFTLLCLSGLLPPIASYIHSFIAASPKYSTKISIYSASCGDYDYNSSLIFNGISYYNSQPYREKCGRVFTNNSLNSSLNHHEKICSHWTYDKTYYKKTLTEQLFKMYKNDLKNSTCHTLIFFCKMEDLKIQPKNKFLKKILSSQISSFYFVSIINLFTNPDQGLSICDRAIWRSFMQSVYYAGVLMGSIVIGQIGKKHGQRLAVWLSLVLLVLGGSTLSFSSYQRIDYLVLLAGRFLIAVGSHGISINSYLLTMEFIDKSNRKYCALVFEFVFAIGQMVLVVLSDESLQYLSKKKDYVNLERLLKKIAQSNNTKFDQVLWKSFITKENHERKLSNASQIVNNFIFHGLGLRSNDLGISPYESFALSAFIELISILFTFRLLRRNFRRTFYFIFMTISESLWLIVSSAMIAKFSIACSYAIIRLYSNEYFPEMLYNGTHWLSNCTIYNRTRWLDGQDICLEKMENTDSNDDLEINKETK